MHLIVQKVLEYFLRRKLNFLFTVIVIGITVYMLSMTMSMYARVSYDLYETKRIFADDQVINVNILMSEQDSRNYYTDVAQFLEAMKERWGENFGKFYVLGWDGQKKTIAQLTPEELMDWKQQLEEFDFDSAVRDFQESLVKYKFSSKDFFER